jgi:histidinol-phosphate aminotransferase
MAVHSLARQAGMRLFCCVPVPVVLSSLGQWLLPLSAQALDAALSPDLPALQDAVARHGAPALVYLSRPHAHSGEVLPRNTLLDWMRAMGPQVFFIIDEAYIEFVPNAAEQSLIPFIQEFDQRLLVLRTFSTAFGLAGLRIGYGLTSCRRADEISRFLSRDTLSLLAVRAALDAHEDREWLEHALSLLEVSRRLLVEGLNKLQLPLHSGPVNFVLHAVPGEGAEFERHMQRHAVRVEYPICGLPGWCRVTVGAVQEMNYYLEVLHSLMRGAHVKKPSI